MSWKHPSALFSGVSIFDLNDAVNSCHRDGRQGESPCRRGRAVSITAVVRPTKKIKQPRTTPANPPDAGDAPAELRASVPRVPSASGIDWDKFPSNKSPERRLEDLSGGEQS